MPEQIEIVPNIGTKVAIFDSGIDVSNIYLKDNLIGGVSCEKNDSEDPMCQTDYQDYNGHGTLCAAVIKSQYPDAGLYAVKILNQDAGGTSQALISGLTHMLNTDIRLINMSVAILNDAYMDEINEVCHALYKAGKIIVCSLANGFENSSPAQLSNVIGVRGKMFNTSKEYWYNSAYCIQCVADMTRMLTSSLNGTFRLFGKCNSKATALFTGKIARIMADKPGISFEELEAILEEKATKKEWNDDCLKAYEPSNTVFDENKYASNSEIVTGIINIIRETFDIQEDNDFLRVNCLYHPFIGVNESNCFEIIQNIETTFEVNLDYRYISSATFSSIYTLADLVIDKL